ncbi:MAG: hypothetical protein ACI8QZ_003142 [Chlamydiales bacterium]|jgi:hypothetical protein
MTPLTRRPSSLLLTLLALAPLASLTTGCVASTGSRLTFSGKSIDDTLLRRLTPGESKEFVLTLFGPPSTRGGSERQPEVWKWRYHESSSVRTGLPGLGPVERALDGAVNVEFDGRTVIRIWRS